ncbi:MAG: hypothetical protein U0570_13300 [Phycisphaerales bacterium]
MNASVPLLPAWIVLPVATVVLMVVAVHLLVLLRSEMPASRRRIRTVNGWLMLFLVPIAACAFGIVTPQNPRTFVLVWIAVVSLLLLMVLLAVLDMANTTRLYSRERRELLDEFQQERGSAEQTKK